MYFLKTVLLEIFDTPISVATRRAQRQVLWSEIANKTVLPVKPNKVETIIENSFLEFRDWDAWIEEESKMSKMLHVFYVCKPIHASP